MNNGYSEIRINVEGEEPIIHTLYFGRQAVEEFGTRMVSYTTANTFKLAADMIYAGMANHATKIDTPPLPYHKVYEIVEQLFDQEDFEEQNKAMQEVFWESKYGKEYSEKLKEFKKKAEKELAQMNKKLLNKSVKKTQNIGTTSEDTA